MRARTLAVAMLVIGGLVYMAAPASAAPALCYYSFASPWGAGSNTYSISSPKFTITNSSGVVTIHGWQSSPYAGTPKVIYDLYRDELFFDTLLARQQISGTFPKFGAWYKHTFTGAYVGQDHYVEMTPASSTGMDGAGNAYDGY